jgi:hypothetical protein
MKNEKVIIGSTAALCGTSVCNKRGCNFFFFFYSSMSTACLIYSIAICCGEKTVMQMPSEKNSFLSNHGFNASSIFSRQKNEDNRENKKSWLIFHNENGVTGRVCEKIAKNVTQN